MSFEYINSQYGVNACVGRRVMAYGEPGTIVRDLATTLALCWIPRLTTHPNGTIPLTA